MKIERKINKGLKMINKVNAKDLSKNNFIIFISKYIKKHNTN